MIAALPILIPFLSILLLIPVRKPLYRKIVVTCANSALLVVSLLLAFDVQGEGLQVLYAGSWQAPFGIVLAIDRLSSLMLIITSVIALAVTFFSFLGMRRELERINFYLFFMGMILG